LSDPSNDDPTGTPPYTYTPPTEPRNQWAAPGWAQGSPPHWFEPLPASRRGGVALGAYVAVLFVVALVGSPSARALRAVERQPGAVGERGRTVPRRSRLASARPAASRAIGDHHRPGGQPGSGHDHHGRRRPTPSRAERASLASSMTTAGS
jgi:hypothetical protein